jgi:hypothetical protein
MSIAVPLLNLPVLSLTFEDGRKALALTTQETMRPDLVVADYYANGCAL